MAESVSALLDGEAGDFDAMEAVLSDEGCRQRFARYSLIGDVLRGDRVSDADLGAAVAARLAKEPPIVAPRAMKESAAQRPGWLRSAGGLALAAGLATVAVIGGRSLEPVPPGDAGVTVASAAMPMMSPVAATSTPIDDVISPVTMTVRTLQFGGPGGNVPTIREKRLQWNVSQPQVQERLNAYLVDYSEHLGSDLRGGMLPYARVVGYDGRQR
ncbi:MAG: sigma-E factor negative regulatory protein [Planctomycetes bacterium]|nr:sigma-E factor negative regulatory protein [Planctomycetota bacterium]